jgi:hypothetical protein
MYVNSEERQQENNSFYYLAYKKNEIIDFYDKPSAIISMQHLYVISQCSTYIYFSTFFVSV